MDGKVKDASTTVDNSITKIKTVSAELQNAWKGKVSDKFFVNMESINSNISTINTHLSIYNQVTSSVSDLKDIDKQIEALEKRKEMIIAQMAEAAEGKSVVVMDDLSTVEKQIQDLKEKKEKTIKAAVALLEGISSGISFGSSIWSTNHNNKSLIYSNKKLEEIIKTSGNKDSDLISNNNEINETTSTKTTSSSNLSSQVGSVIANVSSYNNNAAPGQCVWYVRGRAVEKTGKDTGAIGNGNQMALNCSEVAKLAPSMDNLKEDVILSYRYGTSSAGQKYGHVIYIEGVDGDTVYYTECKSGGKAAGTVKSATKEELFNGTAGCGREVVGLIDVNKL